MQSPASVQAPVAERPVALPPQSGRLPLALEHLRLDYPVDIRRRIDRNWNRRTAAVAVRTNSARHDRAGACPLCHGSAPIAPIASVYREIGRASCRDGVAELWRRAAR